MTDDGFLNLCLKENFSVCFFLGAGASAAFGYPTTSELKNSLWRTVGDEIGSNPATQKQFLPLLTLLGHKKYPDIEYVFEFLKQASKKNIPEVHDFFTSYRIDGRIIEIDTDNVHQIDSHQYFALSDFYTDYLIDHLFRIFRWKQSVKDSVSKIYSELFSLELKNSDKIHVFTTNYDSIIEKLCSGTKLNFIDGFDHDRNSRHNLWKPELFDTNPEFGNKTLFLYKLHGSLTWKKHREFDIIKIPDLEFHIVSDDFINTALIRPTRTPKSEESDPPFDKLFERFKQRIMESDICIVIGYSFRDSLNETFTNFLNQKKLLIVISPEANKNLEDNFLNKKISELLTAEIDTNNNNDTIKGGIIEITDYNILAINHEIRDDTIREILEEIKSYVNGVSESTQKTLAKSRMIYTTITYMYLCKLHVKKVKVDKIKHLLLILVLFKMKRYIVRNVIELIS